MGKQRHHGAAGPAPAPMSLEALEAKLAEIREATRAGNEVLRDLSRERKACETYIREQLAKVDAMLGEHVRRTLEEDYQPSVLAAIDAATDTVYARFDRLANMLLHAKASGRPANPDPYDIELQVEQVVAMAAKAAQAAEKVLAPCKPQDLTDCPMPPWLTSFPEPQFDDTAMGCELCGRPVWAGPRVCALKIAEPDKVTIACYQCALANGAGDLPHLDMSRGRPNRPR